uniref:U-box domain-containing protein n=1 Tax=Opuntia streptacantha TaxID=393608 RepID=A0A7C8ZJU2_OPUST
MYEEMEGVEVPKYFLCPISLHIMNDPVTTTTGITYDRHSIHQWLNTATDPVCPVTKLPLSRDSDLTPNHTLRRLIHAWLTCHGRGDRAPPTPLSRAHLLKLLRGVSVPRLHSASLDRLLALATSEDYVVDRKLLVECGAPKAMVVFIIKCYEEKKILSLEKALRILNAIWTSEIKDLVENNDELIDCLTWVLNLDNDSEFDSLKNAAVLLAKELVKVASSSLVERLNPELFKGVVGILRQRGGNYCIVPIKAALQVMLEVCQHGRNKYRIIEADAIFELIQLELDLGLAQPELKKVTELAFCLLAQLCSCADGRAQLLAHAGGMSIVSNRILRVSPVVDDRAVHILAQISKNTGTNEAVQEMVRAGAVSKVCMVLQADCAKYLKEKVREILRRHSHVWRNSPCFQVYLLSG